MTRADALAAVYTCVAALVTFASGPGVIWAHQPAQAPKVPHIRLTVIGEDRIGYPRRTAVDALAQERTLDIQVDGIGTAAADQITDLAALLFADHPAVRTLQAAGLAIQGVTEITDLAEEGPSGWIRRKAFTLTAGYTLTLSGDAGPAATAIIVDLDADTDGDGVIDVSVDPLITYDLT